MIRWIVLSWWLSTGYRAPLVRAGLGIFTGVLLTVALLSLGESVRTAVLAELGGGGGELRVKPPSLSLGGLDLAGSLLPGRALDAPAVAALGAIPGVEDVWPEAWSRFPVGLQGDFVGQRLYSDGALLGVVAAGVAHDAPGKWTWKVGDPVPVLAPRTLLAVFNGSFAPANGLPRLNERAVVGQHFRIVAGRSSFARADHDPVVLEAEIVGVTPYGGALAGIVPIEVVKWLDEQLGVASPGGYSSVVLRLAPTADPDAVAAQARALGWAVEALGEAARQAGDALRTLDAAAAVAGGAISAVALVLLSQVFGVLLAQRRQDLRVVRSAGLGRVSLGVLLLGELGVAAGGAGLAGAVAGGLVAHFAAAALSTRLSDWTGLTLSLTVSPSPVLLLVAGIGAGTVAVVFATPAVVRELARGVLDG